MTAAVAGISIVGFPIIGFSISPLANKATMATPAAASSAQSDEDRYFSTNPPPKDLERHMALVDAFVDKHAKANRRVVLVTSGGTTVRTPQLPSMIARF